jgi:hypothetical protein
MAERILVASQVYTASINPIPMQRAQIQMERAPIPRVEISSE